MSQAFTVEAEPREDFGKNAARRMRRTGRIPGVVYGGGGPVIPLTVDPGGIRRILHSESGHNAIFTLEIRGKAPARVMIRDWQSEPVHGDLLHVDLVRIALDAKLKLKVPIHVTGEPQGVKVQGGIFEFVLREVEVECLPDNIPEAFTVDVTPLTIGHNLRVADLPVGPEVQVLTDAHRVVAHVVALRAEEEEKPAEVAEAVPAEPEVIRKGKAEEEGAEEEAGGEKKEKGKEKE
ncbi:MAG: 50S ribosomal protein L25 [Acidobacteriia bacterium]|nr:50S ribosomal protein L25 [Terriglobia bacterium]